RAMAFSATSFFISLSLICLLKRTHVSAFNLDTDNVLRRNGEPGSLFGFSLALHRQLHPAEKRILLVGSPRAKALKNQKANVTGGLYSCEISPQLGDCKRIEFDNEADLSSESKENQWMGVTVQSQGPGGKIVTCAHRYQRRMFVGSAQESRDITGRCYVLSENLQINEGSEEDGGNWKFCEGRTRGHERFGSCQQGLSATFTKDYHYVVFGAPGAYNWKGIVRVEQKNSTLVDLGIYEDGPYEVGDETQFDANLVPVPDNSYLGVLFMTALSAADPDQFVYKSLPSQVNVGKAVDVMANSYLGFSLDSGHNLIQKGQLTIVSGAPRAKHSGAVVLLKTGGTESRVLNKEFVLEGPGLASSFGYDVAVVDLNSDGWQDIVVGAPQYFVKDGETGGAVYVYINKNGKWDQITPIQLNGTKDSMFGLAVENIGDVNLDGFQDIAVGAPYDDAGSGKVYIYHGSKSGITTKPAQVLEGRDHNIKLFGYSLAGNMDLDRNSYPDIAIGSLSDSVFVYRSKPVVNIVKEITITPKDIDLKKPAPCLDGKGFCLTVKACFEYTANPKDYSPRLTMDYTFEADSDRRKINLQPRVSFSERKATDPDNQYSGTLELRGQNQKTCIQAEGKLQDTTDKLRGIPIAVSVAIKNAKRRKRQSALAELVPVLSSELPTRSEVNFVKEGCGTDNICQSNLDFKYKFCSREHNRDVFHPLPVENGVPVISLSNQEDIALEVTVTNMPSRDRDGDDAYEAKLVALLPDTLSYSAARTLNAPSDKQVTCTANQNGSRADCDLGNPFKSKSEVTFYIILSTSGITLDTTQVEIDLQLETASEQKNLPKLKANAKVLIALLLSVSGVARPSQVYFGGTVKGESAMGKEDDIGSLVDYEFRVINLGKPLKSFGSASLNVQWPKEAANHKWLLYLMKISATGTKRIDCTPRREVNSLNLTSSSSSRKKRETEQRQTSGEGKFSLFTDKRKYTTLSCGNGTRCVEIRCPLQGLDNNPIIVLRSRLWNSTFLEDYSTLNYLDILVKASLSLDASAKNIVLKNAETQVKLTVFPEKTVAKYTGAPWWIILVAILAGILMLALLVFLLWKCGFFKRSKYDDSVPRYHAVRIRKEERQFKDGKTKLVKLEKKQWMTTWNENESYS
ncbi:ITA6 protein, partial [Atractosteus spatula]|nr:ITA6 protein [Atractosteus spatula]